MVVSDYLILSFFAADTWIPTFFSYICQRIASAQWRGDIRFRGKIKAFAVYSIKRPETCRWKDY
jgi:hypothetical protein